MALGVEGRPGGAVDEDELRAQHEAPAVAVGAHGHRAAAAERVVDLALGGHHARAGVRRKVDGAGQDQRVLVLLAEVAPEPDVREDRLVALQVFFAHRIVGVDELGVRGFLGGRGPVGRLLAAAGLGPLPCASLLGGDVEQRQDVGVDDLQVRVAAQLAAEQPRRLEVGVHVFRAAGDEAGDQHALELRDVQLRRQGRLDGDVIEGRARGEQAEGADASESFG